MGRALDPKKIKSAQRALEVLEYFNSERGEATVMDIARAMGYPQSSTSELLSCLVSLGYLHRDRYERKYRPAARVALLGAWVQPKLFREGSVLPMMDQLAESTGLTVTLATRVELQVQFVHEVRGKNSPNHRSFDHKETLLLHSAAGKALLSTVDRELVKKFAHRLNAEAEPELRVPYQSLADDLDKVREDGFALGVDDDGGAMIAMLIPQADEFEQLAIGIWGPAQLLSKDTALYVEQLRAAIARNLEPQKLGAPTAMNENEARVRHAI